MGLQSGCIQSWKTWKSHRISFFSTPEKVMEIGFGKLKKVMEIKRHPLTKRRCSFSFIQHFNARIRLCTQIKFWCLQHLPVL